jgi:H+-transporting ATPase
MKEDDQFQDDSDPDDEKKGHDSEGEEDFGEENAPKGGPSIIATDQSAITGESLAVDKYMGDVCYYTTGCKRGKAYAVCLTSAPHSFVGRTASLVQGAKDQGHFKAIMNSIGTALLVLVVLFILIAWIGGFFHHLKIATPENSSENLLHYALILLIVGVPVG